MSAFLNILLIFIFTFLFNGCGTLHKADINEEITNKSKEAKEYIVSIAIEAKETAEDVAEEVKKKLQATGQEIQDNLNKLK